MDANSLTMEGACVEATETRKDESRKGQRGKLLLFSFLFWNHLLKRSNAVLGSKALGEGEQWATTQLSLS